MLCLYLTRLQFLSSSVKDKLCNLRFTTNNSTWKCKNGSMCYYAIICECFWIRYINVPPFRYAMIHSCKWGKYILWWLCGFYFYFAFYNLSGRNWIWLLKFITYCGYFIRILHLRLIALYNDICLFRFSNFLDH